MDKENELVQYIIVNKDLNMSPGKVAAQVGHVCTMCALHEWRYKIFNEWFTNGIQKKIILEAHQDKMVQLELLAIHEGFYAIHDNGLTEIPTNSLTAISLGVRTRKEAAPFIKRLQLLK